MKVTSYALVMLFGALVAGIGLVLLFRKQEQSLSRIKLFNQEFQFSAPGLVVFLAGCMLIVLFPVLHINDTDVITLGPGSTDDPHRSGGAVVGPDEREPNDDFETANIIKFGTTTKGVITPSSDRDFFRFQVPVTLSGPLRVRVIVEKKVFDMEVSVYDDKQQKVGGGSTAAGGEDPVSFSFDCTPGAYYYLRIKSIDVIGGQGEYKLILKQDTP